MGTWHKREQEAFHRRGGSELALEGCVGVDHLEEGRHSKDRLNVLKFMVKDSGFSLAVLLGPRLNLLTCQRAGSPPTGLSGSSAHLPSGIHSTGAGCPLKPSLPFLFPIPPGLTASHTTLTPIHPCPAVCCRCHTQICRGLHNPCRASLTGISKPSAVENRTPPFASPE